jgi:hypothetical protein
MLALGGLFGFIVIAEAGNFNVQQLQSLVFSLSAEVEGIEVDNCRRRKLETRNPRQTVTTGIR